MRAANATLVLLAATWCFFATCATPHAADGESIVLESKKFT